jgi:RNA polymerase sigma factor (sigma-70 family)
MALEVDAIVQTLLRERLRVTGLAAVIVRDTHAADDVFQQVVLAALEARGQFRDAAHVLAWGCRAARHRAVDLAKRRKLRCLPTEALDLLEAEWADPDRVGPSDRGEALHRCLDRLPDGPRSLLRMRYTDGLTAVAIAGKLHRTPDAVYQTLSRLHRSLRACVEGELARGVSS